MYFITYAAYENAICEASRHLIQLFKYVSTFYIDSNPPPPPQINWCDIAIELKLMPLVHPLQKCLLCSVICIQTDFSVINDKSISLF